MRTNRVISVAVVTVLGLLGSTGMADTRIFDGGSGGDWDVPNNWDPNGVPTATTRAIIPDGIEVVIDEDAIADTLDLGENATLHVRPGKTLTLENNTDNVSPGPPGFYPDDSIIDGKLCLEYDSTNGGAVLTFTALSHIIDGVGRIVGDDPACKIKILTGRTLTNRLAEPDGGIRASVTVETTGAGTAGTLRNEGLVESNGVLILASSLNLQDISGALWTMQCGGELRFNQESLNLVGDFRHISCGILTVNATVRTCGTLKRDACGAIDVNAGAGATFEYAAFSTTGSCSNPNNGGGGGTCNDPWIVGRQRVLLRGGTR